MPRLGRRWWPCVRRAIVSALGASGVLGILWDGCQQAGALADSTSARLPRVQVLSGGPAGLQPGFLEALRIQLHGVAHVQDGALPASVSGAQSAGLTRVVDRVRATCRAYGATVGLWLEAIDSPASGYRLQAVECAGTRRWAHFVPIVQGDAAATDRRLALKVHGLLDTLATDAAVKPRPAAMPRKGERLDRGIRPAAWVALWGQPALRREVSVEAALEVSLGLRLPLSRVLQLYSGPAFRWRPDRVARGSGDRLLLRSVAPGWVLSASLRSGRLLLSLSLGAFLRIVSGSGETAAGQRGVAAAHVPLLAGSGGLGWRIASWLAFDTRAGITCHLTRRRFSVNGGVLADTGTCGPAAAAAVQLSIE